MKDLERRIRDVEANGPKYDERGHLRKGEEVGPVEARLDAVLKEYKCHTEAGRGPSIRGAKYRHLTETKVQIL